MSFILDIEFGGIVLIDGTMMPNKWELKLELQERPAIERTDILIGIERIHAWVDNVLDCTIMAGPEGAAILSKNPMDLHGGCHFLPEDPFDNLLLHCLYVKINSILEDGLFIKSMEMKSFLAQGITNRIVQEPGDQETLRSLCDEDQMSFADYWYKPDPEFFNLVPGGLQLIRQSWEDIGLKYKRKYPKTPTNFDFNSFRGPIISTPDKPEEDDSTDTGQVQ